MSFSLFGALVAWPHIFVYSKRNQSGVGGCAHQKSDLILPTWSSQGRRDRCPCFGTRSVLQTTTFDTGLADNEGPAFAITHETGCLER